MEPTITVLIPTYNRAQYLADCIDSILSQSLKAAQIIVINDGSTDETEQVLQPFLDQIEYVKTNQLGKSAALNCGLKKASGKYFWIFDDDDIALPDALQRFVEPLEVNPEYRFSYSSYYNVRNKEGNVRLDNASMREVKLPVFKDGELFIRLLERNFLTGASHFAQKVCYEEVGAYDPELFRSQDYDMIIRIARRFRGVRVSGGPTYKKRQHQGRRGPKKERFSEEEKRKEWLKYDRIIFHRLYEELKLKEYLPEGTELKGNKRQSFIQRLALMSFKLLPDEVVLDLKHISVFENQASLNFKEKSIVRYFLLKNPYYDIGNIMDHSKFLQAVQQLSSSSPIIRQFRMEIIRAAFIRFWKKLRLRKLTEVIRQIY